MTAGSPPPDATADATLRRGFRVGDWDVHPLQGVIAQGGHRVHIEPKVMDVLVCLARHPGDVVTRDMLLDVVWKGVVVTDDVVTRCISELRTVLRDTGRDRRFIRTIPKRGYSLLVPVLPLATAAPVPSPAAPSLSPSPSPSPVQRVMDGAVGAARRTVTTTRNLVRSALLGIGLLIVTVVGLALIFGDGDGVRVVVDADDELDGSGVPAPPGDATAGTSGTPPAAAASSSKANVASYGRNLGDVHPLRRQQHQPRPPPRHHPPNVAFNGTSGRRT